jgi:hypothetical protein
MNRAEFHDGLQEIAIGVFVLAFVGQYVLAVVLKSWAFYWGSMLLVSTIGFGSQWAIKRVRKRFLIGKMGYVKLKPVNRKRLGIRLGTILASAFAIAGLVTFAVFKAVVASRRGAAFWVSFPPASWMHAITGIYLGAIMVFVVRLPRYVIGGVIMAAMGILLAFSRAELTVGFTILYGFAGLLALISGCVVFFLLLRQPAEMGE